MNTATNYPVTDDKSKTYQLRINKVLYDEASKLAAKRGVSLANFIKYLLLREIEQDKKPSA